MRAKILFYFFEHVEYSSNENNIICSFVQFSNICLILDPVNQNLLEEPGSQKREGYSRHCFPISCSKAPQI